MVKWTFGPSGSPALKWVRFDTCVHVHVLYKIIIKIIIEIQCTCTCR